LYPKIVEKAGTEAAPKITGMLVDLNVLEVNDVLEFFEDPIKLDDRIEEAREIIQQEGKWMHMKWLPMHYKILVEIMWIKKKLFVYECMN